MKMHHINVEPGELGRYVLLPGDPDRVEKIAQFLDNPHYVGHKREYTIWEGTLLGEKVSVMSTGMGGPSTAIAVEEMVKCGCDTFIRIGTCGGIDPTFVPGDLIIPTAAIRSEGTGREYAPIEYPAVADLQLVSALKNAAKKLELPHHLGIVQCKDSYYGQHAPETMPCCDTLASNWKAWKMAGAVGSEMESATLFLVSEIRRARAATVLNLCRNIERENDFGLTGIDFDTTHAIQTAVEALKTIIEEDRAQQK